jgi:hypothetical protein
MSALATLIDDDRVGITEIASYLDSLDGDARWGDVRGLDRARQRMLYDKAAHDRPIDLTHFIADAGSGREVIHDGINTLPLPAPLKRFQKRFCRAGETSRLFGYNEGPTRRVVGPGYFVAIPTSERPAWSARGAVVIDYFNVPDGEVVEGWPPIVTNEWRLQRFVYHHTRDFMRRVSAHVSIGAAYKRERPLDHYFVLCRRVATA